MMRLTNVTTGRCARWCALVVLVAVCSLTVKVTTRYGSSYDSGSSSIKILQKRSVHESGRQRLDKNASAWMPPAPCTTGLYIPIAERFRTIPHPLVGKTFSGSSLCNRPPPTGLRS